MLRVLFLKQKLRRFCCEVPHQPRDWLYQLRSTNTYAHSNPCFSPPARLSAACPARANLSFYRDTAVCVETGFQLPLLYLSLFSLLIVFLPVLMLACHAPAAQ